MNKFHTLKCTVTAANIAKIYGINTIRNISKTIILGPYIGKINLNLTKCFTIDLSSNLELSSSISSDSYSYALNTLAVKVLKSDGRCKIGRSIYEIVYQAKGILMGR